MLMCEELGAKIDAERVWASRGRDRTVRIGRETIHVGAHVEEAVVPEPRGDEKQMAAVFVAAIFV
jgi:hypothetical protein